MIHYTSSPKNNNLNNIALNLTPSKNKSTKTATIVLGSSLATPKKQIVTKEQIGLYGTIDPTAAANEKQN